ncbi:hypothetical protein G9464_04465 [Halostella sp. JP-L12]|uniref:DUF7537 family lipoprotein n=1 Tax=Halostella TaxID=1843185 RepID=UPI000EF81141|nr:MULTISPECIES: hypothetical protein [Halostella]NHN46849.1 hypothetical protein [Halostella sp. JP-L12]
MRSLDTSTAKRLFAVALVALLVASAGCAQLPGMGGDGGDAGSADVDPYTESGDDLDGETVASDHVDAIDAAGSYTFDVAFEAADGESSLSIDAHLEADMESGDAYSVQESNIFGNQTTYKYTSGNTSYEKTVRGGDEENAEYASSEQGSVQPVNTTPSFQASLVDGVEWSQEGTEKLDGVGVTRYESTGVANVTALVGAGTDAENVTNVSATMLVDADGVVRQYDLTYTVEEGDSDTTVTYEVETSNVGSTEVEEPDWLSEAES